MEEQIGNRKTGEDKAYEEVFLTYYPHLCLFANRILSDFAEAEDIVQEVFVAFLEKKVLRDKAVAVKSYLYASVYNACMNLLKRKKWIESRMEDFQTEEMSEENYLRERIESEVMEEIFATIELLPEDCKRVFKLSYVDGMEVSKVAATLGISENTVKTQRLRARKFLKERLKDVFSILFFLFPHF